MEREQIRKEKELNLPKPWSSDWVFQQTYFCNVRREDDRVTRWIRSNWHPDKIGWDDYEYAMVVARFLNWPDTLNELTNRGRLGGPEYRFLDPRNILLTLEELAAAGQKVWGNAYVVTTHGIPMGKAQYLCRNVLPAAYELLGAGRWRKAYPSGGGTLARRHDDYMRLEGMGSFMSAQVLADLKNTMHHPLWEAKDWATWSAPGPGSLRGLEWFFGKKIPARLYDDAMAKVREYLLTNHTEAAAILKYGSDINMQDLQNCLCEYDKYMRVRTGKGRSKRGYPGK